MPSPTKKLVVIGGGAAGFFCAVNAARLDTTLEVIILEKTNKLLSKVRISGGGRCNLTHACFDIREMSARYPRGQHFVKKAFHQFFTTDTIQWFEERGVKVKTEEDGRMFPVSDSSQTIINCLKNEAEKFSVTVLLNTEVVSCEYKTGRFLIRFPVREEMQADFVCIASGGYPKATMFQWMQELGHTCSDPVPSLFSFNLPKHPIVALMGLSAEAVRVKIEGTSLSEEGPVLITHWGLSGPVVLKLSAWGARELQNRKYEFAIHINWVPAIQGEELKSRLKGLRMVSASKKLFNQNITGLPNRLWQFILTESGVDPETRFADLTSKAENAVIRNLLDYVAYAKGKTTYKEEFVTAGGVNLSEIDPNTMMSRKTPGLYFAGEVLDVDGITGGYNFQHAWTSGFVAAKSVSQALSR